ncbi:MAG TPA: rod shape-determining protein MreC [Candidatus Acidoferrales bacterium]|jgi:rod shape-determining protein MreC|nr:rod shape-determining protein MreC [Candidatus Acidoferrales bacterium]
MPGIPSRHKSIFLLAGVVLLQVLLLALQIKRDSEGRLIRVWTVGAFSPFERAGNHGIGHLRETWRHYFALQNASRENEQLRRENDDLKMQVNQLQSKANEADRLALLLNFHKSHENVPMLGARVIATSAGTASATIMLDRGSKDHLKKNMGVITPEGVVGKIVEVYDNTSEVLLLTDKDSGVGAMLGNSRVQSPVGGAGEPLLVMKYVANDDVVNVGERVVTSGMDKIFPRDLPIGTITDIKPGNPFKSIRIRPSAHLERLEEVIVLLTLTPLQMNQEAEAAKPSASAATKPVGETVKPSASVASKPVAESAKSPASGTAAKPASAPVPPAPVPASTNAAAAVRPE